MEPGTYTLTLRVDGKEITKELNVEKDPRSEGTAEDISRQTGLTSRDTKGCR